MKLLASITGRFSRHHGRSVPPSRRPLRIAPPYRRKLLFEALESRILLSADLVGIPDWVEQGPSPTTGGQVAGLAGNPVSGAIEAVAAHPTDPDIVYVAAVNGGIWRTNNATAASPNWTPLIDDFPGLSMGDINFSPLDTNVLFAGTANLSSGGRDGGPQTGLLRTADGGNTWVPLGEAEFGGMNVRSVIPTAIGTSLADQVVLVASSSGGGGIYRSDDGGDTWDTISGALGSGLPNGAASHLVADPGNNLRFYASIIGSGVFRSDDGGQTWNPVNNAALDLTGDGVDNDGDGIVDNLGERVQGAGRVELSVHNNGGAATNAVYVALIGSGSNDQLMGVFRSGDQGANWAQVGTAPSIHPGKQGNIHFSILADQTDQNTVYVAGDRQAGSPFVANMFVGDAGANTWNAIALGGANGTAPHADSRDMDFDANGNILEADDGGIYRLVNPTNAATRTWVSVNGDIAPTELYSAVYDDVNGVIFGGTQDTGTTEQNSSGSGTWHQITQGDGGISAVANFAASSTHFTMGNNINTFSRRDFDNTNSLTDNDQVLFASAATPGVMFSGFNAADAGATSGFYLLPFVINAVDPARMLLGLSGLYEDDQSGAAHETGDIISNITPAGYGGTVSLAYGGVSGGVDNADVAYVGDGNNDLYVRTTAGGAFSLTAFDAQAGSGLVLDIVLDPDDWNTAYLVDGDDVWMTPNAGTDWTNLTGNLDDFVSDLRTITVFDDGTDVVLLVGGQGGVYRTINPGTDPRWTEYGTGLANAVVKDLNYNAVDDVLVAGTFGRGAWTVPNAGTTIATPGQLVIDGELLPDEDDDFRLVRREANPLLLDVYQDGALILAVEFATLESIAVNGLGGSDELTLDFEFGDVIPFDGVAYDGGIELGTSDQLTLENGTFTTVTYTATGPGAGTVDLDGDVVTYVFLDPILDTTTATNRVFTDATGAGQTIEVENAGGGLTRIDDGSTSAFESITFAPPTSSLTVNAGDGDDEVFVDFASGTDVVNVNGGTGSDLLQVNGTAVADSITVTSTQVTRGPETVNYQQIEDLAITGGDGDDDLQVLSTSTAGARLDAEEGSDDYTVNFGSLAGAVAVDDSGAGADFDTLLANGTVGDDELVLGASSITRGAETVTYFGIEELTLDAGAGNDTITVNGTGADTTVLGGDGDDHFVVNANGAFTLTLDGEEGSDSYEINIGALTGPVVIDDTGTTGTDTLLVNGTDFDDVIVLTDTSITGLGDGSPFDLTFSGIEVLAVDAKAGDDIVDGSALTISVTIYGGDGDDLLIGGSNDDQIFGQGDDDDIIGNLGSDLLDGGEGSDGILGDMGTIERELVAGGGLATLLTTQNGKLEASINRPGAIRRKVTLANEDEGGDDTLIGGAGDDYLHGGAGDDGLAGDEGIDALFGNDGDDTLAGGADDDHLYGGAGDDDLDGNAGADIAYGGDGSDRLVADSSGDRLIDWFGNFNEFVVPGPGMGAPVIVRAPAPWAQNFLLALAADDGALDAEGELGLVVPGGSAQQANSGKGG